MLKTNKKVSERILTFDLLRGYFLCVILLNHLQYYPSGLDLLTGRGILYVSTAEGFFAVSGIVLGIIRGRKLIDAPLKTAARLLWKRGFQLYLTSIILTLLFTFIGWFFLGNEGLKYGIYASWTGFGDLLWQTLTFQYTYGWADFLRYYALFLFASPAALWLLRKGYWYILMSASLLVWSLYPFSPFASDYSQPISWQIIFFGGLTIGYYWPVLVDMWNKISLRGRKIISISLISTTAITMFISVLLVFGHNFGGELGMQLTAIHNIVEQYFDKDRLPLTRVLLGVIWFWALFIVVRKYEAIIIKKVGRFILPLGENSLYVYTIQAFIVFFAHLFIIKPTDTPGILINLTVSILALALVWLAVRTKFLMKIIPR